MQFEAARLRAIRIGRLGMAEWGTGDLGKFQACLRAAACTLQATVRRRRAAHCGGGRRASAHWRWVSPGGAAAEPCGLWACGGGGRLPSCAGRRLGFSCRRLRRGGQPPSTVGPQATPKSSPHGPRPTPHSHTRGPKKIPLRWLPRDLASCSSSSCRTVAADRRWRPRTRRSRRRGGLVGSARLVVLLQR